MYVFIWMNMYKDIYYVGWFRLNNLEFVIVILFCFDLGYYEIYGICIIFMINIISDKGYEIIIM